MFINWITTHQPEQDDRRWGHPGVPPVSQSAAGRVHPEQGRKAGLDLPPVHPAEQTPQKEQEEARRYSEGTIADVQRAITEWADRTFPNRTIEEAIKKLKKEIAELEASGHTDAGELADVAILLFDIAYLQGIDLRRAVANKMRINEGRIWERLEDGTHQHCKDLVGISTRGMHPHLVKNVKVEVPSDRANQDPCPNE